MASLDYNTLYSNPYKFNEFWFDNLSPMWEIVFNYLKKEIPDFKINKALEIGCYEGRATVWLANNILESGCEYDVIDTFGGSEVETGMENTLKRFKDTPDFIYENFQHNISFHKDIKWNITRDMSNKVLPTLDLTPKYDFIYIDASHQSDDTFVDGYYAHKMLNPGGVLIFDDYGWGDPNNKDLNHSPKLGIDVFAALYRDFYQDLIPNSYQRYFYKIK